MSAGRPLSPAAIRRIFSDGDIRLLPEREVIEDFIQNRRLDLSAGYTESKIREADALIVTRKAPSIIVDDIWDDLICHEDHPIVNPMYHVENRVDRILLTRTFPSEAFRREYPLTEAYLPDRYVINKTALREGGTSSGEFRALMRRFVLLSAPEHYGGKTLC